MVESQKKKLKKKVTEYVTLFRFCPKFSGRKKRGQQNMMTCDSRRGIKVAHNWRTRLTGGH